MFKIGLDLGYGYVKGVNETGKRVIFPSLVGNAYTRSLVGLFGNDEQRKIENMHLVLTGEEKEEFFVGDLARRESRNVSYAFDEDKINHPNTSALISAASLLLLPEKSMPVHLVTGLPLEQYVHKKDEFRDMLLNYRKIAVFKGDREVKCVKFDRVTIFPQAAGAVYYGALEDLKKLELDGSFIGLIDIGFKTTDFIVFTTDKKLALREDMSGTIDIGMSRIHSIADKAFTDKTGSKLDLPELMRIIENGYIRFKGEKIDISQELMETKCEVAKVIKDRLKSVWGNRLNFFSTVFLAGGGGKDLHPHLVDLHPGTSLISDPQFANAKGYLKVAYLSDQARERKAK